MDKPKYTWSAVHRNGAVYNQFEGNHVWGRYERRWMDIPTDQLALLHLHPTDPTLPSITVRVREGETVNKFWQHVVRMADNAHMMVHQVVSLTSASGQTTYLLVSPDGECVLSTTTDF